jgi:ADP-ribose pyrophosphatase YjhB (NUDIX family)
MEKAAARERSSLSFRVRRWLFQRYFRATRCLTLGVRVLVRNEEGEILLVRHTYMPGWALPGGGVEKLETAEQTVRHELLDEVAIRLLERPRLFGIYANHAWFPNDHVLLYVVEAGTYERLPWHPSREIAEMGFFPPRRLPPETTAGTRRRIHEVTAGLPPAECW